MWPNPMRLVRGRIVPRSHVWRPRTRRVHVEAMLGCDVHPDAGPARACLYWLAVERACAWRMCAPIGLSYSCVGLGAL